jgi:Eukaryotic-type carbonic anhydrase
MDGKFIVIKSVMVSKLFTFQVVDTPIPIYPSELELLKSIKDEDGIPLIKNNRPVQPIHGRTVTYYD